ncbi:sigma-70 family RNA polymerase sigma factor [Micromonospora sp. STR1_7]|uniref:Sigma-70 family RNA polymerase sigma factor n=1 Tax=Micromonospora parastrephiae TaxID=2806101 RepID=A0ABS1XWS1_9ACTN|nr:sigma-70 family RNA polymerase sigma factor [Micromonospora parastrephiae]MBM0233721.1 sigma-70 family RNA polymerase sigma factor [Micromonospora parastrephiae]
MSALVVRAQAGDIEAFGLVYDRYVDEVFRFVYRRVLDRQTAEDLTSETFVRALHNLASFSRPTGNFAAWLTTIARNLVANHQTSFRQRFEVPMADIHDATQVGQVTDAAQTALDRLTREALLAGVDQLAEHQRQCIVLRFLRELSIEETAEVMGRTPAAIKAIQHKALRALRGLLPLSAVMPA